MAGPRKDYVLDLDDERLWCGNSAVPISNKAFLLLKHFAEHPERLVSKDEIMEALWGDNFVSDGLVREYVHDLRAALKDDPKRPRFIETVPRRGYRFLGGIDVTSAGQPASRPQIYVNVFEDLSATERGARFARGLTDDLLTDLTRATDLMIIQGVPKDGTTGYRLEGAVQVFGTSVRVNVHFVRQETGEHLWAERYDRAIGDFLTLQEELTTRLVAALNSVSGPLAEAELARLRQRRAASLDAWELTRLAYDLEIVFRKSGTLRARQLVERAVALDPRYAHAWLVLGWVYWQIALEGWCNDPDSFRARSLDAYERAAKFDPHHPVARMEAAAALAVRGDSTSARASLERAMEIAAQQPDVMISCANYVASVLDEPGRATDILDHNLSLLVRRSGFHNLTILRVCVFSGDFERALSAVDHCPDFLQTRLFKMLAIAGAGGQAEQARRDLYRRRPGFDPKAYLLDHPITGKTASRRFLSLCKAAGIS